MKNFICTATLVTALAISTTLAQAQTPQPKEEIKPYVEFLENREPQSAKDYILSLFERHDIVILCERDHRDVTQYDLILDVMRDPYFVENVGTVFTEVGVQTLNPALNTFLKDDSLSATEVEEQTALFQRNAGGAVLWDKTNFMYFIKGIHEINRGLPADKKLEMYPTNPFIIEGEPTPEKFDEMMRRGYMRYDYRMAQYITENFDRMKSENPAAKALVIMNYRHGYNFVEPTHPLNLNTGHLLFNLYLPGKVANVLINSYTGNDFGAIQDGRWDAAFRVAGIENAGFDFADTPFGDDDFDHWVEPTGKTYKDVFNGFVYYLPFEKFETWIGYPGLLDDAAARRTITSERMLREAMARIQARPYPEVPDRTVEEYKERYNTLRKGRLHVLDTLEAAISQWIE